MRERPAWLAAAYSSVEGRIFRKVYEQGETIPDEDTTGIHVNEAINAAVLLIGSGQEAGHVDEREQRDVEGVTKAHEARVAYAGGELQICWPN